MIVHALSISVKPYIVPEVGNKLAEKSNLCTTVKLHALQDACSDVAIQFRAADVLAHVTRAATVKNSLC